MRSGCGNSRNTVRVHSAGEPVELHGGAVKVIDQLVVEACLELQPAQEAGHAEQFGAHGEACDGGDEPKGSCAGGRTPGAAARSRFHQGIHSDIGPNSFAGSDGRCPCTPAVTVAYVEITLVIDDDFIREPRDNGDQRCSSSSDGQAARGFRLRGHDPVINGFLEWIGRTRGTTVDRGARSGVRRTGTCRRRRQAAQDRLGRRETVFRSSSPRKRIHAGHPDVVCDVIVTHVLGWLESLHAGSLLRAPTRGNSTGSIEPWLDDYGAHVTGRQKVTENSALSRFASGSVKPSSAASCISCLEVTKSLRLTRSMRCIWQNLLLCGLLICLGRSALRSSDRLASFNSRV